jgi:hypothetical protein
MSPKALNGASTSPPKSSNRRSTKSATTTTTTKPIGASGQQQLSNSIADLEISRHLQHQQSSSAPAPTMLLQQPGRCAGGGYGSYGAGGVEVSSFGAVSIRPESSSDASSMAKAQQVASDSRGSGSVLWVNRESFMQLQLLQQLDERRQILGKTHVAIVRAVDARGLVVDVHLQDASGMPRLSSEYAQTALVAASEAVIATDDSQVPPVPPALDTASVDESPTPTTSSTGVCQAPTDQSAPSSSNSNSNSNSPVYCWREAIIPWSTFPDTIARMEHEKRLHVCLARATLHST